MFVAFLENLVLNFWFDLKKEAMNYEPFPVFISYFQKKPLSFFLSWKLVNPYIIGRYFLRDIWASGKIEAAQVEIVKKIKYTNVPGDGR